MNLPNGQRPSNIPPKRLRVLVVEDSEDDKELLLRQIKKANIEEHIIFTDCGLKAIELLRGDVSQDIFAVFLDLSLRGASGLEVLRSIRANTATATIPVVVMTGSTNPGDKSECYRLNVAGFLPKPIEFAAFCKAVAGLFHMPK